MLNEETGDAEYVSVCPNSKCGSSQIRVYGSPSYNARRDGTTYTCQSCGERFDEPDRREAQTGTTPKRGLAAQLARPDARLATDGGADSGE